MKNTEKEILNLISMHYDKNQEKALTWYNTPHKILSDYGKSPKQIVEEGRGKEVLEWLKMVLDK